MRRSVPGLTVLTLTALTLSACGKAPGEGWLGYAEGEDAFIAAPLPGWVEHLGVQRGDAVKPGQVLFSLDDTQQRAARDQAAAALGQARATLTQLEAQRNYATKELTRQTALVRASAGTKAALDVAQNNFASVNAQIQQVEAQAQSAAAALTSAEYQLSQRTVIARQAGRVEDIYFRTGEYLPAATPVLSVLPPRNVFVRFFVPETAFSKLHLGQRVRIACDGCKTIEASVTFIAQQEEFTPPVIFSIANRDKLVFKAEARAPGGIALNPGQPVNVTPLD